MAVTQQGPLRRTTKTPQPDFLVDGGRRVKIYRLTKLAGDTTHTLTTTFSKAFTATVYDADLVTQLTGATAVPNATTPSSLDLAVLGAGTEVFVVAEGVN